MCPLSSTRGEIDPNFALRAADFDCSLIFNFLDMKTSRSWMCSHFLLRGGRNWAIFALWAAVSEIQIDFKTCHIWQWSLEFAKHSRRCIFPLSGDWSWAYFCSVAAFFQIQTNFQNCHIWVWNQEFENCPRSCIRTLNIWAIGTVYEVGANFPNFHIWVWNLNFEKQRRRFICPLLLSQKVEIGLIFALRAGVFKIHTRFHY